MMGLLGNVAEVVELRPQLMDKQFLTVFNELLDSSSDGIEVILVTFSSLLNLVFSFMFARIHHIHRIVPV